MAVMEITKENFRAEVLSGGTVLLDFWAQWCPPCMMQSPIVDEIASERPDIKVGKIDTDAQPELSVSFDIENIPTLIIIKNGEVTDKLIGLHTKEQILGKL